MFGDGPLTFREFAMREPLPLANVHDAVLEFLRDRDDAVLYGAQAVNAYVKETRITDHADVVSTNAQELAEELRQYLRKRYHIAVRIREVKGGVGLRLYQVRKPENRHLVDVRPVKTLPPAQRVNHVLVVTPAELIAGKVSAWVRRRGKPKAGTDWRDVASLLLTFPKLKAQEGEVAQSLRAAGADQKTLEAWKELVAQEIVADGEDDKFAR